MTELGFIGLGLDRVVTLPSGASYASHLATGILALLVGSGGVGGGVTLIEDREMGYIVAKIEPGKHPWAWKDRKPTDGVEDKYRFMRHVEKLEGIVIHPGAPQN